MRGSSRGEKNTSVETKWPSRTTWQERALLGCGSSHRSAGGEAKRAKTHGGKEGRLNQETKWLIKAWNAPVESFVTPQSERIYSRHLKRKSQQKGWREKGRGEQGGRGCTALIHIRGKGRDKKSVFWGRGVQVSVSAYWISGLKHSVP